jgi:hypothetical protein
MLYNEIQPANYKISCFIAMMLPLSSSHHVFLLKEAPDTSYDVFQYGLHFWGVLVIQSSAAGSRP